MRVCSAVLCMVALAATVASTLDTTIGAAAGVTLSGMVGDDFERIQQAEVDSWLIISGIDADVKTRWGLSVAACLFLTIDLNSRLAIQPEIWYAQTRSGMETTFDLYSDEISYLWVYRFLEVPVLLKARFAMRGLGTFGRARSEGSFYLGPAVLFLLVSPPTLEFDWNYGVEDEGDYGTESTYRRTAFAVVGGVDLRRHFGRMMAGIDVRADWHLTSFDDYGSPYKDDTRMPGIRVSAQIGTKL